MDRGGGGEGYGLKTGSSYMYTIRVHQMPLMSTNIFFYLILKCSNGQDINMRQIWIQFNLKVIVQVLQASPHHILWVTA